MKRLITKKRALERGRGEEGVERCHGALEKKRAGWEKKGCGALACFYRETKKGRKLVALLLLGRRLVGLTLHVYSGCLPPALGAARCALQKKKGGGRYGEGERRRSGNEFPACPSTKSAAVAK